jgi:predicted acyltransferase
MAQFFYYVRGALAILLAVIGLRIVFHLVSAFSSGEPHSSVEIFLLLQTISLPCSFLSAAYLLVFQRYRVVVMSVLILSSIAWLPSVPSRRGTSPREEQTEARP